MKICSSIQRLCKKICILKSSIMAVSHREKSRDVRHFEAWLMGAIKSQLAYILILKCSFCVWVVARREKDETTPSERYSRNVCTYIHECICAVQYILYLILLSVIHLLSLSFQHQRMQYVKGRSKFTRDVTRIKYYVRHGGSRKHFKYNISLSACQQLSVPRELSVCMSVSSLGECAAQVHTTFTSRAKRTILILCK